VVSTFGGQDATFGGLGWEGWLEQLNERLGEKVFFWPSFFLPPETFTAKEFVDGTYAWNGAWPMGNHTTSLEEDRVFLAHPKPYMASVSPLFFTHYGTTGQWAFNKNFIYRSDDLLYPSRWTQLLSLPPDQSPDIIQVISWNDYGESHSIAPVLGAQPGSESWTEGMNHEAFREMTRYFIGRWRDDQPEVGIDVKLWIWYRTHPAAMSSEDEVGRPANADWARDLINLMILVPETQSRLSLHLTTGSKRHSKSLTAGSANTLTIPFEPGPVSFELSATRDGNSGVILSGEGRAIVAQAERYNFNMWSGSYWASL